MSNNKGAIQIIKSNLPEIVHKFVNKHKYDVSYGINELNKKKLHKHGLYCRVEHYTPIVYYVGLFSIENNQEIEFTICSEFDDGDIIPLDDNMLDQITNFVMSCWNKNPYIEGQ